ncbi:MAG TPA: hypothetical protein VIY27_06685 [Myxococcota bacterium]
MDWLRWIPEPATLDLWVWGLLVLPVVLVGIPLILASVRVPRRLALEVVSDAELSGAQRRWFEGVEERLRQVGFEPAVTFSAPDLPSHNLSRAFTNGRDGSVAVAMALRDRREGAVLSDNLLELTTEFGDGSFVNTRSRAVTDLFDLPPGYRRYVHVTRDPLALHRHHERHCRAHTAASPQAVIGDGLLARLAEFHERWIGHQIGRGLLRERDAHTCGPTLRLALRGTLSFFDPFGDRFSLLRLLAGLAAGLGAPLIAVLALSHPSFPVVARLQSLLPLSNGLAEMLALTPVLLASAASVGWIFESRAVVWAPLLISLAGWLALPHATPDPAVRLTWLLVLLGASLTAHAAANTRLRRQAIV